MCDRGEKMLIFFNKETGTGEKAWKSTFSARGPWAGVWEEETISSDSVKLGNILVTSQGASLYVS
jgi:hypothetical protein